MKAIKTAVSLPAETYSKAEKIRKKLNKTRSEFMADALARLVKSIEIKEAEERYAAAYKAMPETPEEIAEVTSGPHASENDDEEWEEPHASR